MKICRFDTNHLGIVEGRNVYDVSEASHLLVHDTWPQPPGDLMISKLSVLIPEFHRLRKSAAVTSLRRIHLNSPVVSPSKIIGAPVNYLAHQDEVNADPELSSSGDVKNLETYGLFLKSNTPVGPDDGVHLRFDDRRTDHEVEMAIVIGRECANIDEADALDYVAGYTIGLDMTVRGPEDRSLRKTIDTYSVLGPWLVTANEIENPDNLNISLSVNGNEKQNANTGSMIYSTRKLIAYASTFYTLHPGDVIMSGTPAGVGPVSVGDKLECTIEKIGTMVVPILRAT